MSWWNKPIVVAFANGGHLGWKTVPIHECGERLVELPQIPTSGRAYSYSAYYYGVGELAQSLGGQIISSPRIFVREAVAEALNEMQVGLDEDPTLNNLQVVVLDGWRSLETQGKLFRKYRAYLNQHFGWKGQNLDLEAQRLVSRVPSRDQLAISPPHHSTGGAVDLVLVSKHLSIRDAMRKVKKRYGGAFDQMFENTGEVALTYFENGIGCSAQKNRRLQYHLMTEVGEFSVYPEEWWHGQIGNQLDALIKGEPYARYGYIEP